MDRILNLIPKNVLAFSAIVLGMLFIFWRWPLHTLCDSQIEVINAAQGSFIYKDSKTQKIPGSLEDERTTKYQRLRDRCKQTNDPGGCYEFFQAMKMLLRDLGSLTTECAPVAADIKEIRLAMNETAKLLVSLAWGEKPPESYASKVGWLDVADLSLFCLLKARITLFQGEPAWTELRETMMRDLPGAKDLPRNQVWDLSILSTDCARYP